MDAILKPEEPKEVWWPRLHTDGTLVGFPSAYPDLIYRFDGTDNAFLSNFYNFEVTIDGVTYKTTEHYYQAMKPVEGSVDPTGQLWSEKIRLAETASKTKKLGQLCPLRLDWEPQVKLDVMRRALIVKFVGTELEERLLATKNAYLIEGNTWHDNSFGICILKNCPRGCGVRQGMNYLGKLLMEVRLMIMKMRDPMKVIYNMPCCED
jgi:ribA/ribD-fused uncharacterized protein